MSKYVQRSAVNEATNETLHAIYGRVSELTLNIWNMVGLGEVVSQTPCLKLSMCSMYVYIG